MFNVGKSTAIEAVQDVVNGLYELRDEYIKFPETLAEVNASIGTFADLTDLPGNFHSREKVSFYFFPCLWKTMLL